MFYLRKGGFAYIEASGRAPGDIARLASPSFTLTGQACLSFANHMYGEHIGRLRVQAAATVATVNSVLETVFDETRNESKSRFKCSIKIMCFPDELFELGTSARLC